ncbi:MAG: MoaD/ThiS family protein [Anaerolineae bacterium]|jgi:MoaD family protein
MEASVRVKIRYLATLRDGMGRGGEEVEFPAGSTLQDLADWISGKYDLSLPAPRVMATLNGRGWNQLPLGMNTRIGEGDVIALFPPIAGG